VRLLNGGFTEGPDGDRERAAMDAGWRLFLHNMRVAHALPR
jgi:hypothetical protein